MKAAVAILMATDGQWELEKDRIRKLYVDDGKTLVELMQLVGPQLNHPSQSTWKKQLSKWRFDVKHHKYSTIVAAAAYYQHCKESGRPFYYAPQDCKPVSLKDLQRYLQRRRLTIINGRIVHRTRPAKRAHDGVPPKQPQYETRGTVPSESDMKQSQCCNIVRAESSLRIARNQEARLDRLLTFEDPECFSTPETVYSWVNICLISSWAQDRWDTDENGHFCWDTSLYGHSLFNDISLFFSEAWELRGTGQFNMARKIFRRGLSQLKLGISACLPLALRVLLRLIARFLFDGKVAIAKVILSSSLGMIAGEHQGPQALQFIFQRLQSLDGSQLQYTVLQSLDVYADTIRILDRRLEYQYVQARLRRLELDTKMGSTEKIASINLLMSETKQGSSKHGLAELNCMTTLARVYLIYQQPLLSYELISNAITLFSITHAENTGSQLMRVHMYDILSKSYRSMGMIQESILAQTMGLHIALRLGEETCLARIRQLAQRQGEVYNVGAVRMLHSLYQSVVDQFDRSDDAAAT